MSEEKILEKILRALKGAADVVVKDQFLSMQEKMKIIDTLLYTRMRIVELPSDPNNFKTRTLLLHLDEERYARVSEVLRNNSPLEHLHCFSGTPLVLIQSVFKAAKIECPRILEIFHAVYPRETVSLP